MQEIDLPQERREVISRSRNRSYGRSIHSSLEPVTKQAATLLLFYANVFIVMIKRVWNTSLVLLESQKLSS